MDQSFQLPHGGGHIKIVKEGRILLARVREENKVLALLKDAMEVKELNALKTALAAAMSMSPPLTGKIVDDAKVNYW